jgi:hypothetical protein
MRHLCCGPLLAHGKILGSVHTEQYYPRILERLDDMVQAV